MTRRLLVLLLLMTGCGHAAAPRTRFDCPPGRTIVLRDRAYPDPRAGEPTARGALGALPLLPGHEGLRDAMRPLRRHDGQVTYAARDDTGRILALATLTHVAAGWRLVRYAGCDDTMAATSAARPPG